MLDCVIYREMFLLSVYHDIVGIISRSLCEYKGMDAMEINIRLSGLHWQVDVEFSIYHELCFDCDLVFCK